MADDMISVPRDLLAAACYCVRQQAPDSDTYRRLSELSLYLADHEQVKD